MNKILARIQALLAEKILVLDGAMGTMIQRQGLDEADYRGEQFKDWATNLKGNNDLLCLTNPEVIQQIHLDYLNSGAHIIETNTFNANRVALADYEMEHLSDQINYEAAQIARRAVDQKQKQDPNHPCFVAGAIGPTNKTASISPDVNDPGARNIDFDTLVDAYYESAAALHRGGVDLFFVETIFDTLNAKAALFAIAKLFDDLGEKIPVIISGTVIDKSGRTLTGQTVEAFYYSLRHIQPLAFGLNCGLGADPSSP